VKADKVLKWLSFACLCLIAIVFYMLAILIYQSGENEQYSTMLFSGALGFFYGLIGWLQLSKPRKKLTVLAVFVMASVNGATILIIKIAQQAVEHLKSNDQAAELIFPEISTIDIILIFGPLYLLLVIPIYRNVLRRQSA